MINVLALILVALGMILLVAHVIGVVLAIVLIAVGVLLFVLGNNSGIAGKFR